jgi:hypothetical protein
MRRVGNYLLISVLLPTLLIAAQACTAIPRDTHGALERATGGVVRVGVIEHRPWTIIDGDDVSGIEPQLLQRWASGIGATIEWRQGDLEHLIQALHDRDIDVLAAGFYSSTPYAPRVAMTQPYVRIEDPNGKTHSLVLAVTPGESALLLSLDRALASVDPAAVLTQAAALQARATR